MNKNQSKPFLLQLALNAAFLVLLFVSWPWRKLWRIGFDRITKYVFWTLLLTIMVEAIYLLYLFILHQVELVQAWRVHS